MTRRRRAVLLLVLGALLVPVVAAFLLLPRRLFRPYHLPAPPSRAPLASIAVHQVQWKDCKGVDAVLRPGSFLCDVINCDVVEGMTPGISADAARTRYGPPAGEWRDPFYGASAYYYDFPAGRVSLALAPDSGQGHWVTVGYPKRANCEDVVRDAELLAQVREIKGTDDEIYFTVRPGADVPGGLGLHVNGNTCDSLELHGIEPSYRPERRTAAQQ